MGATSLLNPAKLTLNVSSCERRIDRYITVAIVILSLESTRIANYEKVDVAVCRVYHRRIARPCHPVEKHFRVPGIHRSLTRPITLTDRHTIPEVMSYVTTMTDPHSLCLVLSRCLFLALSHSVLAKQRVLANQSSFCEKAFCIEVFRSSRAFNVIPEDTRFVNDG